MTPSLRRSWVIASVLAVGQCSATAQPGAETITLNAQGGDYAEFFQNPHMREFYELSVAMLRASPVDVAAYEQRSYEVFRALASSLGWPPEGLLDHLKHIPRELVGIAKDDPKALDSFENFLVALRGPP
jgi:hypothetical protein